MIFGMITQSCDCACLVILIILRIEISYFNNLCPQKDVCEAAQSKHDNFDPLSGINSQKKKGCLFFVFVYFRRAWLSSVYRENLRIGLDSCLVLLSHTHENSRILGRFIPTRIEPNNYLLNVETSK